LNAKAEKNKLCWFETWFDSVYYHILYKNRDNQEAELFIDNLIDYLQPSSNAKFLDMGCGRGRHSVYLNKKGYDVTGLDLSTQNIAFAKTFENKKLHFFEHDMRRNFKSEKFDFVLNLFTSFGYFANANEDIEAILAMSNSLKPKGKLVLDFFNAQVVVTNSNLQEQKTIDNIEFEINKKIDKPFVVKTIKIKHQRNTHQFEEKVKLISLDEFENYFAQAGLTIIDIKGNYHLDSFDAEHSDRLILIAEKN
jgi:SAM-dependent methyltransferase